MRSCTKITSGHNFCGFTDLVCYCIFSKDNLIHKGNQVNDTEAHIVYHNHTTSICEDSGKNLITNYIAFITRRLLNRWNVTMQEIKDFKLKQGNLLGQIKKI